MPCPRRSRVRSGLRHTVISEPAGRHADRSAFGLLAAIQSLGNFAASGVAGLLWTALSPSWAFAYLTTCMAVATVLLIGSLLDQQRRSLARICINES